MWVKTVSDIITSNKKFSLSEAKTKLDVGNRLKFTCPEYKELRKSYQAAKAWSKKVKKSGLDDGTAQIYKIKELIKEHDTFLISMPEEKDALKQALCPYCICRRPYEGFMIGCDECEEWYHGPCIGISQAQGNKIDKYLCVRCCVKKVYKNSCSSIAGTIRKWCDTKEMAKARSQDAQKHQRKVREKKREIVKWREELESNVSQLEKLKSEETQHMNGASDTSQAITSEAGKMQNLNSTSSIPTSQNLNNSYFSHRITEVKENIAKATTALEQCNRRMEELSALGKKRKATLEKEDSLKDSFRYWCLLLRTKILTPESIEEAEKSRPRPSLQCKTGTELLSPPMREVLESAAKYGIDNLPDVVAAKNLLECISWCHFAFSVFMRKPKIEEIKALVDLSSVIKLPEVKSIGMMRSMISRTSPWQLKANMEQKCVIDGTEDISTHAPDPMKLWPPCGLIGSEEALKALGTLPSSLKLETIDEPKPGMKGYVQAAHLITNGSKNKVNLQMQHTNKNALCEANKGSTSLCTQADVAVENSCAPKSLPDQQPAPSVATCSTKFVEKYLPSSGLKEANLCESKTSPFPTIVKPVSLDQPKTGRTSDVNTQDAINRAFIGKPPEKVAESLQGVFSTNSFPRILEGNSVIDAKAAAEVAALASTVIGPNSGVTNGMFNGYYHQPINIVNRAPSSMIVPRQINAYIGGPKNNKSNLSSILPQQLLPKSESVNTNLINGVNQPQSSMLDLKCPSKTSTLSDPAKDPQFITSNVAPQAIVPNTPVKATAKPSVLLKKFG